ncbi:MAG: hypothetical protein ACR2JC_20000 [Chloroflexota bacterium]|nr:MAG: hypothetical protein DLM70_18510 [Chloroflexota bacterium]
MLRRHVPCSAGFAAVLSALLVLPVQAAPQASFTVQPYRVGIGRGAVLVAAHLRPMKYYTFLLVVPGRSKKPRAKALLQTLAHADSHGAFRLSVKIPVLATCGKALMYAIQAGTRSSATASFVLTGCTASGRSGPPPAPPAPKSKKKHKS